MNTDSKSMDLFASSEPIVLDYPDSDLRYWPNFLPQERADDLYQRLRAELDWQSDTIWIAGQQRLIPRLQAWYGDVGADYQYSGLGLQPLSWPSLLTELKQQIEQQVQHSFNSVLANWYRGERDSISWHSDDEPELGQNPVIAGLSLGEVRKLKFRHRSGEHRFDLEMAHGSLLLMAGPTQHYWQHGIPKSARPMDDRISLTFREIYRLER